tara:strand:- start:4995 stop:5807 length:813 start_codon:yes stop_codon:yes gene_type:complete
METFYFGRLNYTSNYNLYNLLTYGNKFRTPDSNNRYGIFSVSVIDDVELGVVFTGELVKYQDLKEEEVVKDNELTIEYIKDAIQGRCRFFLTEKSHLIAYNPYGKVISPKAFCEAFSGVIIGADDTFNVDSEIYPINQEYEFMNFIKTMSRLETLIINLTPSNPNNRDIWKNTDDRLNEMNVKKYKEEMTVKKNQSIEIDELTESKIIMAQDGYGKAIGSGKDLDGNDVTVSTDSKESVMKKKINKDLSPTEQHFFIRDVFNKIIDRFKS